MQNIIEFICIRLFIIIISPGLRKKLGKLGGDNTKMWKKSITNHLYYIAAKAPSENRQEYLRAMWLSLDNHIHDEHEHNSALYPYCDHVHLLYDRNKGWLKRGVHIYHKVNVEGMYWDLNFYIIIP